MERRTVPEKSMYVRVRLTPQEMRLYVEKAEARAAEGLRGGVSELVREAMREKLKREASES